MNYLTLLTGFAVVASQGWTQAPTQALPKFEDYPVAKISQGTLATPKLATSDQRSYRTRITEGITKGWGARVGGWEGSKPGPNFAGKMVVVQWMCGSPCLMMAMVDAETGVVYPPPKTSSARGINELMLPILRDSRQGPDNVSLQFRPDSRLLIVDFTPDRETRPYTHYFLWDESRWKLLRRVLIPEK